MKKIILFLMLIVSVSFSYPQFYQYNGVIYKYNAVAVQHYLLKSVASCPSNFGELSVYSSSSTSLILMETSDCVWSGAHPATPINLYAVEYNYVATTDCASPKRVVGGECVEPEKCDNVHSQFLSSSTGQCVDCMPFPTLSGRASCACDALGGTYTPTPVTFQPLETVGGYSYSKESVSCSNGASTTVYYDPVPIAEGNTSTPTDGNTSTQPKDTVKRSAEVVSF